MAVRYTAERGSNDVVYKKRDWEVLDNDRHPGSRVICRAERQDAIHIAASLNASASAVRAFEKVAAE